MRGMWVVHVVHEWFLATFFDKQIYNSFFQKNRLIVSLLHVFLGILSPQIWLNDHREVNERMKEVLMMEWLCVQVVGVWHCQL